MKKNIKKYTLIEILAAMGVFMIICLVVMRFFSGAQRVMVNTSNSSNLSADVRVVFDLIGRDLQSIVFNNKVGSEGIYPFVNSYYTYKDYHWSVPTSKQLDDQKSNIKLFYTDIVPAEFEDELSYTKRDYAPLLCFISSQSNLPSDANYDLCEIRYTFVPAGVHDAIYKWKTSNGAIKTNDGFSGGTLLRSCTYSDINKTSSSDTTKTRHPHDFSAFPLSNSLGEEVLVKVGTPPKARNRVHYVFNDESSGKFEQVISGVYRMNISCFKLYSETTGTGTIRKFKMFDVNHEIEPSILPNPGTNPPGKMEFNGSEEDDYLFWPPKDPANLGQWLYKYPADGSPVPLGQLGHPLPDMIKVDLYMLDSKSWDDLMNCYKFSGSNYTLIHKEEAKKILDRKLQYFTKVFYIPKVDTSTL